VDHSPSWEANSRSASQIPRSIWYPKVHYLILKSLLLIHILSQMNQIHTFSPCFRKILFPSGFQTTIVYAFRFSSMRTACSAHLILLHLITLIVPSIWWGVQVTRLAVVIIKWNCRTISIIKWNSSKAQTSNSLHVYDYIKKNRDISCSWIEHHAMKAYWGNGGLAPSILDLSTRWRWMTSFKSRPLYPQGKSPWCPLDRRLGEP